MYLETQRGKVGMKTKHLNPELGATAGCTVRAMEAFPEATDIKGDAYFDSVACASELAVRGFEGGLATEAKPWALPQSPSKILLVVSVSF